MHSCWDQDPSQRPEFPQLRSQLVEMIAASQGTAQGASVYQIVNPLKQRGRQGDTISTEGTMTVDVRLKPPLPLPFKTKQESNVLHV